MGLNKMRVSKCEYFGFGILKFNGNFRESNFNEIMGVKCRSERF